MVACRGVWFGRWAVRHVGGVRGGRGVAAIVTPAALVLPGCQGHLSALAPATAASHAVAGLWWAMLAGGAALFLLVVGLFCWVARPSARPRARDGRRWVFWGAVVLPALVLPPLVAWGLWVGEQRARPQADALVVRVTAQQWRWTFSYPQLAPGRRYAVLHLPAARPVRLEITSRDVIHSFWAPQLAGKLDALPGHVNALYLEGLVQGTYSGQCAEFCGTDHTTMRFEVVVHDAADFAAALARGAQP